MTSPHVHILLGTFNGSRHVQEQLDSIRNQTFTAWTLLVRDDGSQDHTLEIVRRVAAVDPRIEIVLDDGEHVGCVMNFARLAMEALERDAAYVMFSDQDDIWFSDKIEKTLRVMLRAERKGGQRKPVLIHTDMDVIDSDGVRVHASFMSFQKIHHSPRRPLRTLVVQNFVTGCTAMVNRSLLDRSLPIPPQAIMHDWWLALCAAYTGSVEFVNDATMSYRRHGENAVTVRGFWPTMNPYRTDWQRLWSEGISNHARAVLQARALMIRMGSAGSEDNESESLVRQFVELHDKRWPGPRRMMRACQLGVSSQALPRLAILYLRLLSWSYLMDAADLTAANHVAQ